MDKFFKKVEELQHKPLRIRKQISYITTGISFGIVFLFWLSYFPAHLTHLQSQTQTATVGGIPESPLSTLGKLFGDAKESLGGLKEGFKTEVEFARKENEAANATDTPPEETWVAAIPEEGTTSPETDTENTETKP